MSTGRKTRKITFNLKDRGRQYTGQNRDNVDYQKWIDLINSPATQEMINTGSMLGYYGHQIRIAWGLNPPETVCIGDKLLTISPATRTIEMSCDTEGNVTHRVEFLETPEGEQALRQYRAKIGGFSAAHDHITQDGIMIPTEVCGMDYVLQPNYATNVGDGILLDSVNAGIHGGMMKANLEASILQMYDSIHSTNFAMQIADENLIRAMNAENQLLEIQAQKERRLELQKKQKENLLDSALCPTQDIDAYIQDGKAFMSATVVNSIEPSENKNNEAKPRTVGGMFNWF